MNRQEQESEISERELTAEELNDASGGLLNGQTEQYRSFIAGLVKGYMDAGGKVVIKLG